MSSSSSAGFLRSFPLRSYLDFFSLLPSSHSRATVQVSSLVHPWQTHVPQIHLPQLDTTRSFVSLSLLSFSRKHAQSSSLPQCIEQPPGGYDTDLQSATPGRTGSVPGTHATSTPATRAPPPTLGAGSLSGRTGTSGGGGRKTPWYLKTAWIVALIVLLLIAVSRELKMRSESEGRTD